MPAPPRPLPTVHEPVVLRGPPNLTARRILQALEGGPRTAEELRGVVGTSDKTLYKHLNLLLDLRRIQVLPLRQERGWGSLFFLPSHLELASRMAGFMPTEGAPLLLVPAGDFPPDPGDRIRRWMHWQFVQSERLIDHALRTMPGTPALLLRLLRWRRFYERTGQRLDLLIERARAGASDIPDDLSRRLLATEDLYLRADRHHPDYPRLVEMFRRRHRDLLAFVGKMLAAEGQDFPSWIRSGFPAREDVAEVIRGMRSEFVTASEFIEKGVVRVPRFLRGPLLNLLTLIHREYFDILESEIDGLYRRP